MLHQHRRCLGGVERKATGQAFKADDAKGVEIAAAIDRATGDLFRAHVVDRAENLAILREPRGPEVPRDPEVGDDDSAGRLFDHQVFRLDVAMDDAASVGVRQRPGHLAEQANGFGRRNAAEPGQPFRERLAVDEPHREEGEPVNLIGPIHRHDVGMGELRRGSSFAEEAVPEAFVGGTGRREHLERHQAVEFEVPGQVDDAHAPASEFPDQVIVVGHQPREVAHDGR